ncbi:hypothetical protein DKX38_024787 [Salix brachista]|uniref:Uncharacterized protein n=1 Tax=Salix brachista TaxID=2182728 RepID=A0A5N5JMA9_9ROSI|nr:hypothetical protein DKX38_024787 [Salix brachista]
MDSKIKSITARSQEIAQKKNILELRENVSGGVLKSKSWKILPSTSLVDLSYVCGRDDDKEEFLKFLFSDEGCDEYGIGVIPIVGMGGVEVDHAGVNIAEIEDGKELLRMACADDCFVDADDYLVDEEEQLLLMGYTDDYVVDTDDDVVDTVDTGINFAEIVNFAEFNPEVDAHVEDGATDSIEDGAADNANPSSSHQTAVIPEAVIAASSTDGERRNRRPPAWMEDYETRIAFFDVWCCVSEDFDVVRVTRTIVEAVSGIYDAKDLNVLQLWLREKLAGKKFLIVLDDVWNENYDDWTVLRRPFQLTSPGSRIIVTTPNQDVALMMSAFPSYHLKELSFDDSLSLFAKHAVGRPNSNDLPDLLEIGQQIVQRCRGLPMAVQTLGGLLRTKPSVDEWESVLNSKMIFPDLEKTRHMSFTRRKYEVLQRFKDLGKLKRLRTFIAFRLYSSPWGAYCYLSNNVLHEALLKLRHLRVLSLSGYCITELPNSIGDLKQLRYLDFSQTKIKQLPESVSKLINLQTLKLCGCRKLQKLPQGTGILINLCHLDITGTDNLIEMPSWMGNLTGLQTLSKFIVGKKEGCGIEELKGLKNLQGRLSIMALHNVIDARRAAHANLRGKHNLDELELKWSESDLKGHPSFSEIVHLELSCCRKCTELPPLGRLPSLRDLCIQGLDAVETVGPGFYGVGSSVKPFQSLKTLKFEDMREWKSWWSSAGVDEEAEEEFPSLSELTLWNCPKLRGKLPSCLPSCVKITIAKCPMLVDSDEKLPVLSELKLEECDGVTLKYMFHKSSPTTLKLGSMSKLTCLTGHFLQSLGALKVLMISDFPNLTSLWEKGTGLENFEHPQLVSSTEIGMPSTHKSSKLSGCDKLELLPIHKVHMLLSLEDLCIETCPNLVSIPEAGLLSSLRHLVLRDCKALRSLPDGMSNCPLEDLEIEECPLLKCFPGGMLPATLKSLKIRYCTEFKSLPEGLMHNENGPDTLCHFDHLEIIGCPSLKSFPDGKLPTRLKTLKIWDCSQLKPRSEMMLHDDMSLQYLAISDREALSSFPECLSTFMHLTEINSSNCSALTFFPGVGLSLASLRALTIYNCKKLKCLPNEMQKLTSLQKLTICSCPALESFPNGDLPPNLTSLVIWDCDGIDGCLSNWNLQSLAFLRDFSIAGQCFLDTVSFPDEKCLLPTTLTSIWIARLPNLESLSMQLRSLAFLEELEIADCPKLKSLPREGLPPALGRLSIRNCLLMTKRCSKEKGVYWPLISHIPFVEINDGNAM